MVSILPFDSVGAEDFLILPCGFGADALHALDEILDWLFAERMKRGFGVCDEKLELFIWIFLIALFVKDFERECFDEDLIAALVHKSGLIEDT